MCLAMANAQKHGYTPVIIDTEGAWTGDFVNNWKLDPDNILYVYTPFVDEATQVIGSLLDSGEKFIIGLDSIGNLETEKLETELKAGDVPKADQGMLQKRIKRMLKILLAVCKKQNSIALIAGHYYGSPSQYGSAQEIGGGYHMRLAPHIILSLKKSKILDGSKNIIGNRIKAITLKNRFYPAFQETLIDINYREGIDKYSGLIDVAMDAGFIERKGAWYKNIVTGDKCQGASKINEIINDDMLKELDKYIEKTGYSTINDNIEEVMEEVDKEINKPNKKKGE